MPKILIHLLGSHLGFEFLSDFGSVLLFLKHLVQECLLSFLGSESGLATHRVSPLWLRGNLFASILLHLLLQYAFYDHSVLGFLQELQLLELCSLIHVHLVFVHWLLVCVLILFQFRFKSPPGQLKSWVICLWVSFTDKDCLILLEIEWRIILEALVQMLLLDCALRMNLSYSWLLQSMQFFILNIS